MLLSELWGYVKRNFWYIVVAALLVAAAPWTLIFVLPIAVISLFPIFLKVRLYRAQQQMFENMRNAGGNPYNEESHRREEKRRDGEVTVVKTEQSEPRVNDDVGEYVDFKEINDEK